MGTAAGRVALAALLVALLSGNVYQYRLLSKRTAAPVAPTSSPAGSPEETVRRFHELSYLDPRTWRENRWLGILTEQNPNDVWITQEIFQEVKPDFVVEAGTLYGGSAALWATILQPVNPQGRVITIDIADAAAEARKLPIVRQKVDFLIGSSTAPDVLAAVQKRVKGKRVVVILDSDHHKAHVLEELRSYGPLVSPGSYLILQDTNINGHPVLPQWGPGPSEALDEFLATEKDFESDRARERLLFTMHPRGYLKRLR